MRGEPTRSSLAFFLDVSGDGTVTPLDALLVINHLNGNRSTIGEGEGMSHGLLTAPAGFLEVRNTNVDRATSANRSLHIDDLMAGPVFQPTAPSIVNVPNRHPFRLDAAVCNHVFGAEFESALDAICEELQNSLAASAI